MKKGVFLLEKINQEKLIKIQELGFNAVFLNHQNLGRQGLSLFQKKNLQVIFEIAVFPDDQCPQNLGLRKKRLEEIKTILDHFYIDGLWLDFIRFPLLWEVKNPSIRKTHTCSGCQSIKERSGLITNFVSQVRSLINRTGRKIDLGMFAVPWRKKDFQNAITKIIGQDFESLAKYIDVFSPMTYHQMCGQPPKWIHQIVLDIAQATGKSVWPIIQTENKPKKISQLEFEEAIFQATQPPSQGVIVFFLEDLLEDDQKIKVVKNI